MNEELIKEILKEIQVRCPNARMIEKAYAYQIMLGKGASAKQVKYICKWRDFSGIDIYDEKLVISFDKQ